MSQSLAPECNELKERYDTCFLKWYSEKYLRGISTSDNNECATMFKEYNRALKERGIDKLLDEAREDFKENDAALLGKKKSHDKLPKACSAGSTPPPPRDSMHPFSVLTLGIFVAGYITARWDLVTRLYELAIFAWDYGVVVMLAHPLFPPRLRLSPPASLSNLRTSAQSRAAKGFAALSLVFLLIFIPVERLAARESTLHPRAPGSGVSAREQLRRRGSF
ncbi:pig-Q [Podospora pseudoanserina]|uniref:Pig-Q n=1 Tax=Podospora pseudoanserina TaxID=2609844 RepID=A0ABR0I6W8_9PEZI|nr:pig-Q [Podospora pseudoanserina]